MTCAGLTLLLVSSHILNSLIFPNFNEIAPEARDISTYFGVIFFGCLAILAYRKPALFHEKTWTIASFALIIIGAILLYFGISQNSAILLILGSPFGGIGAVWFSVLVCISLTKLDARTCALCIPIAFVLKYLLTIFVPFLTPPLLFVLITWIFCTFVTYLLVLPYAAQPLKTIQRVKPAAELDITNPMSFLPFSSPVFITIILFYLADGYALTFQPTTFSFIQISLAFIPLAIILCIVLFGRKRLNADKLFFTSALLVFAGFLLVPLVFISSGDAVGEQSSGILLRSGADCFSLLMYYLIARIGARNELSTIFMVALTVGSSWLGIAIGALLGQITSILASADPTIMLWVSVIITFIFVAYNFIALRRFSFEETIEGIRPVTHVETEDVVDDSPTLDDRCEIIMEEYGLTNREGDVFKLLARGRTSSVIQEKLFLSHNTVKTHVRHIYTKMDIHSQQELIDIVENSDATGVLEENAEHA